jgi:Protein of unknown function (DUF1761)
MIALGVVIAMVAGVVVGAVVYGAIPATAASAVAPTRRPPAAVAVVELLRNGAVAGLVAGLLAAGDWTGWTAGARLGAALWILPAVLLSGSVFHEGVTPRRAAIHALDWAVKLVAIGAIVGPFV